MLQSYYYYYYYFNDYNGKWLDVNCNYQFFSVCYNGSVNGKSSFVKVNTPLNWIQAQRYCRENYVDLASVRNRAENFAIAKLAASDTVWIGLHQEPLWSDGSPSVFQYWASGQPDSTEQCVTTAFRNSGLWSDDNCSLTLPFICYSTTPPKTEDFRAIQQAETYITLQWNKVNNSFSFILQFNGAEININAPAGDGRVTHTVSSLTARTKYTFTLFSVFENVRSSGVNITAVTAPPNAYNFISTAQDETSITLQWNKVNNVSYILQFNSAEIDIAVPDGDGPVTYTVSSLTPGTTYVFTLYSVFENARSSGVSITAVTRTRQFYFEATPLNWTEAQSFCRRVYTDLATIRTSTDAYAILSTTPSYRGKAWIGLYDDNWRWSLNDSSFYGEGDTGFRNWAPGHPYLAIGQNCVLLQNLRYFYFYYYGYSGTWVDVNCNDLFYSVCYNGSVNGTSSFVKVDTPFNWTEAQRYCRENYVDLASIRNRAENDIITKLTAGDDVWIGLHREQLWSDGSTSMFQYWVYGQPDSPEQCVTTMFSYSGRWSDDNCSLTLPFICYSTTPPNAEDFRPIRQDETSITLQARPLFDIKCLQQSVCRLHLPHCEIRSTGGGEFLSVAHVNDEGIEFIGPQKITETHVVINITGFSGFGNVKDEDSPADPVRALVLLFYRPPADPDAESLLNVLLLPRNVVLRDVLRTRKKLVGDESYIETSPHCKLQPKQEYTLSTCPAEDSVLVQPTEAEFDCDNYDNYFPSFQVILETMRKHVKLFLRDTNSSHSVWERRVCLTGVKRSCGPSALNLSSDKRLLDIRSSFIEGISGPVLTSLLDKLFEKTVIAEAERESADEMQNRRDKARFVIDSVRKKGEAASSEMIEFLCEADPFLCEHLGLI
ncbi:macrophage mannose receptor 1-like [Micropterus dolomieu]|uniref:macrophage mannose receptor 1-like n=1 Tax=Micropterus dolomieu TaxID=147949 RepID=UPI001E8D6E23|nr:macrophage mannose receptor 1-like [Micropterus dolomieu]